MENFSPTKANVSPAKEIVKACEISDILVINISLSKDCLPVQPKITSFPKTLIDGKNRGFNSSWYDKYKMLEYSVVKAKSMEEIEIKQPGEVRNETFTTEGDDNGEKALETGYGS